jgi:PAS domain-containing protein
LKAEDSTTSKTPRALILSENVTALSRATALLIVVCQLAYLMQRGYTDASTIDVTQRLILANVGIGVLFFLLTFTAAIPRYWREVAIFVGTALLVTGSALGAVSMRVEPLFVSVLVIVIAAGTLAPWDWGWQAAINSIATICFFVLTRRPGIVDSDPALHWVGLMTAVSLAQANVYLQMKNRRAAAQNLEDRQVSDRKLKESEEKFRQIFQQSGDMVVVSNLDTGTILEVNNQFVRRSGVSRELVVGRSDLDFNCFADASIRE